MIFPALWQLLVGWLRCGVWMVDTHASGGQSMLEMAEETIKETHGNRPLLTYGLKQSSHTRLAWHGGESDYAPGKDFL